MTRYDSALTSSVYNELACEILTHLAAPSETGQIAGKLLISYLLTPNTHPSTRYFKIKITTSEPHNAESLSSYVYPQRSILPSILHLHHPQLFSGHGDRNRYCPSRCRQRRDLVFNISCRLHIPIDSVCSLKIKTVTTKNLAR
jgi:hypothetical protein